MNGSISENQMADLIGLSRFEFDKQDLINKNITIEDIYHKINLTLVMILPVFTVMIIQIILYLE